MPNTRLAIVGAFVIGGALLFAVGLFRIADRRMLFADTLAVHAEFAQVSALMVGNLVRVAGMNAGEVEQILLPAGPGDPFRVRMRVRRDLHPLVRLDSVASIQTDGLIGNRFVQIQAGTEAAPPVEDGGTIQSRQPVEFADLIEMMSDTIETVNTMLVDVKANVDEALLAISATVEEANTLIEEVGDDVQSILASTDELARDLARIVAGIREGRGAIGRLITDDALYESARAIAADAEQAMAAIRDASVQARNAIAELRGPNGAAGGLTGEAQVTIRAARSAMTNLAEATEALKRNFLVRGFFERRGYFDLQDVTVAQYREGALKGRDRRVLRIWLASGVLFERDAAGAEQLSAGGMARLDSAMSQFVRYAQGNPFVVEGYAQAPTGDARYLISRARAEIVREYLMGRFGLDPVSVTTMPMGDEAEDSPAGDHWDGIGLAVFVPAAAL